MSANERCIVVLAGWKVGLRTIDLMKLVRERTSLNLAEAKAVVERVVDGDRCRSLSQQRRKSNDSSKMLPMRVQSCAWGVSAVAWWCRLATVVLFVAVVGWPLRASAATVKQIAASVSVPHEATDAALIGYDGSSNPSATVDAKAGRGHKDGTECTDWCELRGEGTICGALIVVLAAGGGGGCREQGRRKLLRRDTCGRDGGDQDARPDITKTEGRDVSLAVVRSRGKGTVLAVQAMGSKL